jgi:hypothetical protein
MLVKSKAVFELFVLRWEKIKAVTTVEEVKEAYRAASLSMARLNRQEVLLQGRV